MRLQAKLLLAIVPVITLAMLTLGSLTYAQLRQDSKADLLRQMALVLTQNEQQTESFVGTAVANARLFSSSSLIRRYVMVADETERYELLQPALLTLFASYRAAYPPYREIQLLMPDGYEDTRLASPALINRTDEEADSAYFRLLSQHDPASISTMVGPHADDGATVLRVSSGILLPDADDSALNATPVLRAWLSVSANLDFLAQQIRWQRIGRNGHLLLLDRHGTVLFQPDNHSPDSPHEQIIELFEDKDLQETTIAVPVNNKPHLAQARRLVDGLLLVALVPESEFDAASHRLALTVAGVTLVAIVLTSLLFFVLLRSMVLRPITQLRQNAIAIGNGQLDARVEIQRADEIGDLASAFREMNGKLANSMQALHKSHAQIEHLAYRDSLTGLPNRRLFLTLVEQSKATADRDRSPLAILFLDLDDFKKVNDSEGHEVGDQLLQEVSRRLCEQVAMHEHTDNTTCNTACPIDNPVARLGGDEFIIMLNRLHDGTQKRDGQIGQMATGILATLARPIQLKERVFHVGTSIGIAQYPQDAQTVDGLVKCADTAMYEAKHHNKNTWRFYGESMKMVIESRLQLENDLRAALQRDEFELYYQPQFHASGSGIAGAEVLLRWQHPEQGQVAPDEFIPMAEDIGLIGVLGQWVLQEACDQWQRWASQGIAPARLAVNVSQRQFALSDLSAQVRQLLDERGLSPTMLEIELTESCMMEAPADVVATLEELRRLGVRIAMDDFGTGYSSLGALTALPIDTLKIDRSFISGIRPDTPNEKIVSAILMLGQSLQLEIVAEGVETRAELDWLRHRQCDLVQGYHLSRPLPAKAMTRLLMEANDQRYRKAG